VSGKLHVVTRISKEIYSYNGTNFKATEEIVKEELKNFGFDKLDVKYKRVQNALEAEDDDAFPTTYCLDRERLHADLFWKRWLKEYMPIITRQSK